MGIYDDYILPRLIHFSMSAEPIMELRRKVLASAAREVLEIGFGSGLNLPCYPPRVTRLRAVEPSLAARKMAAKAVAAAPFPVEMIGLDGQKLPVETNSIDCVVSTWTLCTIPDVGAAMSEIVRVLKPGGRLLFLEHGLSPDPGVARWQQRLDGMQGYFAGGCHLTRDMEALVSGSSLRMESLEKFYMPAPRTHGYVFLGSARKSEQER